MLLLPLLLDRVDRGADLRALRVPERDRGLEGAHGDVGARRLQRDAEVQVRVRVREIDNRGRINLTLRGVPQDGSDPEPTVILPIGEV